MFILNNFYSDRKIMVVNQYYGYYYVCQNIFLSDCCNVMFVTIKMGKNLLKNYILPLNETKLMINKLVQ